MRPLPLLLAAALSASPVAAGPIASGTGFYTLIGVDDAERLVTFVDRGFVASESGILSFEEASGLAVEAVLMFDPDPLLAYELTVRNATASPVEAALAIGLDIAPTTGGAPAYTALEYAYFDSGGGGIQDRIQHLPWLTPVTGSNAESFLTEVMLRDTVSGEGTRVLSAGPSPIPEPSKGSEYDEFAVQLTFTLQPGDSAVFRGSASFPEPPPACGDGVVDPRVGEECDPPSPGSCDDRCRVVPGPTTTTSTTTTTLPPPTTTTTTTAAPTTTTTAAPTTTTTAAPTTTTTAAPTTTTTAAPTTTTTTTTAAPTTTTTTLPPPAAVRFEEIVTGGASESIHVTTSAPIAAVAGHLYLAAIASKRHEDSVSVSGLGLDWSEVEDRCSGRSQTGVALFRALGSPSSDGPVTATFARAPLNAVIAVGRYSGVDPADPLGTPMGFNSNGADGGCQDGVDASGYSFPYATTRANAVVFAGAAIRSRSQQEGAGYQERTEFVVGSGGDAAGLALMDQAFASAGGQVVDAQLSSNTDFALVAVELRPGGTLAPACADGLDNDGDGLVDFGADLDGDGIGDAPGDPGCHDPSGTTESPQCQDGVDNDGRTGTDYDGGESVLGAGQGDPDGADPECVGKPWKDGEARPACGLGWEAGLVLALLARSRRGRPRARPERG